MLVYLCRHAAAAPGDPDDLRPLTVEGVEQARRLGARLASVAEPPAVILSSPLVRARQTAAAIATATGAAVYTDDRLAPGATIAEIREIAADATAPLATVGHQPDCSEIALAATGRDPGFAPGTVQAIEIPT